MGMNRFKKYLDDAKNESPAERVQRHAGLIRYQVQQIANRPDFDVKAINDLTDFANDFLPGESMQDAVNKNEVIKRFKTLAAAKSKSKDDVQKALRGLLDAVQKFEGYR